MTELVLDTSLADVISTLSTTAGTIASDLEDCAASGQPEAATDLVCSLDQMCVELMQIAHTVTIDALRSSQDIRHDGGSSDGPSEHQV